MIDFTKIKWAGEDCILITRREDRFAFLLTSNEIERLLKEWESCKARNKGEIR